VGASARKMLDNVFGDINKSSRLGVRFATEATVALAASVEVDAIGRRIGSLVIVIEGE
jgi:hypothetical protein